MHDEQRVLDHCLNDVSALISSSIGPAGFDKLVETDTKTILVTNNGLDILNSLNPLPGLSTLVLNSIKAFTRHNGDASKRLVLMLCRGIQTSLNFMQGSAKISRVSLVHGLAALQDKYLEALLAESLAVMELGCPIPGKFESSKLNVVAEVQMEAEVSQAASWRALQEILTALVITHMTNKVGSGARNHLAGLLIDLVMRSLCSKTASDTAWDVLNVLRVSPPVCWSVGLPVTQSRLLNGLVVHGQLSSPLMVDTLESAQEFYFMLLKPQLDAIGSLPTKHRACSSASVEVKGREEVIAASHSRQRRVCESIEVLRSRGVTLLLSLQPVSPLVSSLCLQAGIAVVPGVEEEDAQALATASGADLCEYTGILHLQGAKLGRVVCASRIRLGAASHALLLKLREKDACTLQIQAPNEGLCRQYTKLVQSSLAVLAGSVSKQSFEGFRSGCQSTEMSENENEAHSCRFESGRDSAISEVRRDGHTVQDVVAEVSTCNSDTDVEWLAMVPGGGAVDAAIAVKLLEGVQLVTKRSRGASIPVIAVTSVHMGEVNLGSPSSSRGGIRCGPDAGSILSETTVQLEEGGDSVHLLHRMIEQSNGKYRPCDVLPALEILLSMARALPSALAASGIAMAAAGSSCSSGGGGGGKLAEHGIRRGAFLMVESLLALHRSVGGSVGTCKAGLLCKEQVSKGTHLRVGSKAGTEADDPGLVSDKSVDKRSDSLLEVHGDPAAYGVIESRELVVSTWCHAIGLLIQVLRIDGMAASSHSGSDTLQLASNVSGANTYAAASVQRGSFCSNSDDEAASATESDD
ncbi:hypothetical protein CEUSTIGMA_g6822.t1 [Chlamydomonas eustigma]|uniref:Uncharacterized protein n=1 Tax=Chlamydomonas eustigma TaxID=1157962 RepID=A0A250X9D4_9CHLO|nr:hypothetical protein CEUSTIGMA_g6822.t1 [Chlamydomonas eustigma]|eukprot:GAX79380.1 hypothetical protein CEUSTIGMA_g6822.t1 [Chlamydomonas eustigma]